MDLAYIAVERAQEGTSQLAYGANGYLVQEPTAGTYTALKNLLLITEKFAGRMGTALPGTCSPGMLLLPHRHRCILCLLLDERVDTA